jgi:hypothetical protein
MGKIKDQAVKDRAVKDWAVKDWAVNRTVKGQIHILVDLGRVSKFLSVRSRPGHRKGLACN